MPLRTADKLSEGARDKQREPGKVSNLRKYSIDMQELTNVTCYKLSASNLHIFIEFPLCAKLLSMHWRYSYEQNRENFLPT